MAEISSSACRMMACRSAEGVFGQRGQRFLPGALDLAPPPQVDAQLARRDAQVGSRLPHALEAGQRPSEQTHESE
jgi:hypothetical protein